MADNVTADPGSGGAVFATALASWSGDSANFVVGSGGILTGAEGGWTFTLFVGGAGAVTAGVQRMTLASDDPAVTSLGVIDDWDESDRAKVNLIAGQAGVDGGSGTVSALTQRVVLATDVGLPAGTNAIGKLAANAGVIIGSVEIAAAQTLGTVTTVSTVTNLAQLGGAAVSMGTGVRDAGTQRVTIATDDLVPISDGGGSVTIDSPVGTPAFVRLSDGAAAIATLPVKNTTAASGSGMSMYEAVSAASNNAASVKGSAGQVYGVQCFNINASPRFLKFYNKATSPSPGSDTVVKSILIPGNSTSGGGCVVKFDPPIEFSTGIAIACVTGISNTDNTSTSASEVILNIDYK